MKRRWIIVIIVIAIFIVIGATSVYVYSSKAKTVSLEELPRVMTDSIASLYFSTTADQDMNRDGLSFVVFVDNNGETKLWEMDGLELGTIHEAKDTFFMEDRGHVYLVDSTETKEFEMETEEHTGEVTAFKDGFFYSVYNSGFTEDGGYASNIRIGNSNGFETVHIPHYMYMSGISEDEIVFVAEDEETLSLYKTPLQKDVQLEEIVSLGPIGDKLGLSPIVKKDGYYYLLISDTQQLTGDIYQIDEQTKEIQTFSFVSYTDADDYRMRVPYNLRNAATVHNGVFYYADGMGDVHSYDFNEEQANLAFSLDGASRGSMKMNEQTYFKNDALHFFRYEKSTDAYAIDTYDLDTGKRISELPIQGLDDMFKHVNSKRKRISSYDFVVR